MVRFALAFIVIALSSGAAYGNVLVPDALRSVEQVRIGFSNAIVDGCLPNPGAAQSALEAELRRRGLKVGDGTAIELWVSTLGREMDYRTTGTTGLCVASHQLMVLMPIFLSTSNPWVTVGDDSEVIESILIYEGTGLIYGPKEGFQTRVEEAMIAAARIFMAERLRYRRNVQ